MKNTTLILIALVLFSSITGGCQHMNNEQSSINQVSKKTTITTQDTKQPIKPVFSYYHNGNEEHFTYKIMNQTDREVTFKFNSGQRYDYIIRDSKGNKVSQLSEDRIHTMSLGEETVKPGESLEYNAVVKDLDKGNYTIEMWLTASGEYTFNQTKEFTVE